MADKESSQEQTPKTPEKTNEQPAPKKGTSNKTLFIIIGAVAFVLLVIPLILFFFVFGFIKDKFGDQAKTTKTVSGIIESATGGNVQVDANGKEVTVKTKDGTEISSAKKLPTDWPSTVVVYSPYTIVGSYKTTTDGKPSWTLATTTSDSYEKVKTDVVSKYAGWDKKSEYESSGTVVAVYEKDGYDVIVTITEPNQGDEQVVSVNYSVTQK